MQLTADQELRKEFLLFSLGRQPDVEAAIEMAALMERFVLEGRQLGSEGSREAATADLADHDGQLLASNSGKAPVSNRLSSLSGAEDGLESEEENKLRKRRWSKADDREFKQLWQSDRSLEEIANTIDRTVPSLYSRARALGMAKRTLPPKEDAFRKGAASAKKERQEPGDQSRKNAGSKNPAPADLAPCESRSDLTVLQTITNKRYPCSASGDLKRSKGTRQSTGSGNKTSSSKPSKGVASHVGLSDYFVDPVIQFLRSRDYSVVRVGDGQFQLDGRRILSAAELREKANQVKKSLGQPPFTSELSEPVS